MNWACRSYTWSSRVASTGCVLMRHLLNLLDVPVRAFCEPRRLTPSRSSRQGYRGCAIGKGRQLAKTEIEKLKLEELTAEEALVEAARM